MAERAQEWFLFRDSKRYGPFSDDEVTTFHQTKQLLPNDLFWCEGFREWLPLSVVFGEQQPASPQWQRETTQRKVVQRSPPARKADKSLDIDIWQKGQPQKTPLAIWGWMAIQVSVALPGAMLLGAAIAYAYQYLAG